MIAILNRCFECSTPTHDSYTQKKAPPPGWVSWHCSRLSTPATEAELRMPVLACDVGHYHQVLLGLNRNDITQFELIERLRMEVAGTIIINIST